MVWPMIEFEADDALASAASIAAADERVERVVICTPDKDLAQCVQGERIVQLNRRTRVTMDESGVVKKYGVTPRSIPDYLALVGDSATVTPDCQAGEPNRQPLFCPNIFISRRFQPIGGNGVSMPRMQHRSPRRSRATRSRATVPNHRDASARHRALQ